MIACPLVVSDLALELPALEAAVHAWGLRLRRAALARAWAAQAALRPAAPCSRCGGTDLRAAPGKPRPIETLFGPVQLPRRRVRCAGCGRHHQPDDAVLAPVLGPGRCTPAVRDLAARCGASWPYQPAARVVGRVRGAPLSAETLRAVVAQTGQAVAAQHTAYATSEQTLRGDTAAWLWAVGRDTLAEATAVLDRWHLTDARQRTLRRAVAETEARTDWTARLDPCLERGDVPGALAVLADLAQASAAPVGGAFAAFLAAQAPRLPDSAARRAAGLPVGSGGVEQGGDVVVNRRFKDKRGMRWGRERAEGVLALRVAELNDAWTARLAPALGLPAHLPAS